MPPFTPWTRRRRAWRMEDISVSLVKEKKIARILPTPIHNWM
jgi:hypothetical protein